MEGLIFGNKKGKGLDLKAEPPRIKRFRAPSHSGTLARSFLRH